MPLPMLMPMTPDDLDEIMVIERQSFTDAWTRRMYTNDLTQNELATYLTLRRTIEDGPQAPVGDVPSEAASAIHGLSSIAYRPSVILAYGGFWLLMEEAHIATIASHPDYRGCGLGEWLMLGLLDAAIARGATCSTLEVRASNRAARQLYQKLGYEATGVRKRYYRDGEDGIIMTTPALHDPAVQARLAAARADALARMARCFGE